MVMSEISDNNPWISLANLLSKRVPVSLLATFLENNDVKTIDSFGRLLVAPEKESTHCLSKEVALSCLAGYFSASEDAEQSYGQDPDSWLHGDSPLCRLGWPMDEFPEIPGVHFKDGWVEYNPGVVARPSQSNVPHCDGARAGVNKQAIIRAFDFWDEERWKRLLAKPPQWLIEARVGPVKKRHSALWNPAEIANCLWGYREKHRASNGRTQSTLARQIPAKKQLEHLIQNHFPDWLGDWRPDLE